MPPIKELEAFLNSVRETILAGDFLGLKLSKPSRTSQILSVDFAQYSGESRISGVYSYQTQSVTKHYEIEALLGRLNELVGTELFAATLFGVSEDIGLDHNRRGEPTLIKRRPSRVRSEIRHNRTRDYLIPESAPFLRALKLSSSDGIRPAMAHKFRQINKFVEIFDATLKDANLLNRAGLRVCDLGAGKSYLTFAVEYHLRHNLGIDCDILAIERRADLVEECSNAAKSLGSRVAFRAGDISSNTEPFDVFVALHACDTATDDAIVAAIKSEAKAIFLAPCCQKWLRNHRELVTASEAFLRDGIVTERYLSMLTDLIRAAALERLGFAAKIFEFIGSEDTDKNIMISGVASSAKKSTRCGELKAFVDYSKYYLFDRLKSLGYEV